MGGTSPDTAVLAETIRLAGIHKNADGKPNIRKIAALQDKTRGAIRNQLLQHAPELYFPAEIMDAAVAGGVSDPQNISHFWKIAKDPETGSGYSLFIKNPHSGEKAHWADSLRETIVEEMRLPPLPVAPVSGEGVATMMGLADLHIGRNYGTRDIEEDFNFAVDDIVSRLPPAEKAYLIELGDLLDANDHKGLTPGSGNLCDVIRDDHLANTQMAIRLMKRAIYRLAEKHATVEVHMIPGNHDPSAYMAVLLAINEAFANSEQVKIFVPRDYDEELYRVIEWGECGLMPHHGDRMKWSSLKDVWADQFPDSWARCKVHRAIWTAHLHHYKAEDLVGCEAKHFRTVARRQKWEIKSAYFSRGTLSAESWHKDRGFITGTLSHIVVPRLEELAS